MRLLPSKVIRAFVLTGVLWLGAAATVGGCCFRDMDLMGLRPGSSQPLPEARAGHKTVLTRQTHETTPAPEPPEGVFRLVKYKAPVGELAAYVTPSPGDGKRHPAVLWIVGGFEGSIDDSAWEPAPEENDQSARAFREAGLVLMLPSLRGGNDNPGYHEGYYGEVDDVLAAADYLQSLDYVDPARIYLGGHSSGGTLVLLVAESTDRFRAVFSLGPVPSVNLYEPGLLPFSIRDSKEVRLRSPVLYMQAIKSPTLMIEGAREPGNSGALGMLANAVVKAPVKDYTIPGADHFSVIAPVTRLLAQKINEDTGAGPISLSDEEVKTLMQKWGRSEAPSEGEQ